MRFLFYFIYFFNISVSLIGDSHVLLYLVDASNTSRFEESHLTLCEILKDTDVNVPIILIINKLDIPNCDTVESISQYFLVPEHLRKQREFVYFGIVAKSGDGVDRMLLWIRDAILTSRIIPSSNSHDSLSSLPV